MQVPATLRNSIGIQEAVLTHSLYNAWVPCVLPFAINATIDDQMAHVNAFGA